MVQFVQQETGPLFRLLVFRKDIAHPFLYRADAMGVADGDDQVGIGDRTAEHCHRYVRVSRLNRVNERRQTATLVAQQHNRQSRPLWFRCLERRESLHCRGAEGFLRQQQHARPKVAQRGAVDGLRRTHGIRRKYGKARWLKD